MDAIADRIGQSETLGRTRKYLIVDLDKTLWGGIVAEEGTAGIMIDRGDPSAFFSLIRARTEFEKLSVTSDDRAKTRQYADNEKRVRLRDLTGDLENYLHDLETKLVIRRSAKNGTNRIHQLFTNTNQFYQCHFGDIKL